MVLHFCCWLNPVPRLSWKRGCQKGVAAAAAEAAEVQSIAIGMTVCLSVNPPTQISKTTRPNFTKSKLLYMQPWLSSVVMYRYFSFVDGPCGTWHWHYQQGCCSATSSRKFPTYLSWGVMLSTRTTLC